MKTVLLSALTIDGSAAEAANALERLLREANHEVHSLDLSRADVSPCLGCSGCSGTGRCVLRDDMTQMIPEIASCDRLVLAAPIVFGVHHPLLKAAVDRFLPLAGDRFAIRHGEMHHRPRFSKRFSLLGVGWLGADAGSGEAETYRQLIDRHAVNLACPRHAAIVLRDGKDAEIALRNGFDRLEVRR